MSSEMHSRWVGTFGPLLDAKRGLLGAQAANQYAEAGLRQTQAGVLPADVASQIGLRRTQGVQNMASADNLWASAAKSNAETAEIPEDHKSFRALQAGQTAAAYGNANQSNASAGATNLGTSMLRPFLGVAQKQAGFLNGLSGEQITTLGGGATVPSFDEWKKSRGYAHGGMVGYANGGKGLRRPGPIGDVSEDTGADTVDAKVRPGEYMLNPETVARAFGQGDYNEGVRNLNQIVRDATGKEPGPTPVGKSGEPGYAFGGETLAGWYEAGKNMALNAAQRAGQAWDGLRSTPMGPPAPAGAAPAAAPVAAPTGPVTMGPAAPAAVGPGTTIYTNAAGAASSDANMARFMQEAAQKQAAAQAAARAEQLAGYGKYGEKAVSAGKAIAEGANVVKDAAKSGITKTFGSTGNAVGAVLGGAAATAEGLANVTNNQGFYDDPNVPTVEKAKQWMRDASRPAATLVGGTIGAGAGAGLASVATGAAGALGARGLVSAVVDEKGDALKKWEAAHPKAPAAQPAAAAKPAMSDEDMRKEYDAYVKAQGLRNTQAMFDGYAKMAAMIPRDGAGKYVGDLMQLQAAGARGSSDQTARENTNKMISDYFKRDTVNDKGVKTGTSEDPAAERAFKTWMSGQRDANGNPIQFHRLDAATQNEVLRDFQIEYRGMERANKRFLEEGGENARTDRENRRVLLPAGEISIGDIGDPNISLGDWAASWGPNKVEKTKLWDPVTRQYVAARHYLTNEDGTLDSALLQRMNAEAERQNGLRRK